MRVLAAVAEVWSLNQEPLVLADQKLRPAGSKSPLSGREYQAQTSGHLKRRSTGYKNEKPLFPAKLLTAHLGKVSI